jgi:catechol 2,3-dioxygenase-like lactoylglutathione lyase family enzyme
MADLGLTHVALTVSNVDASISFYEKYAHLKVVHRRTSRIIMIHLQMATLM